MLHGGDGSPTWAAVVAQAQWSRAPSGADADESEPAGWVGMSCANGILLLCCMQGVLVFAAATLIAISAFAGYDPQPAAYSAADTFPVTLAVPILLQPPPLPPLVLEPRPPSTPSASTASPSPLASPCPSPLPPQLSSDPPNPTKSSPEPPPLLPPPLPPPHLSADAGNPHPPPPPQHPLAPPPNPPPVLALPRLPPPPHASRIQQGSLTGAMCHAMLRDPEHLFRPQRAALYSDRVSERTQQMRCNIRLSATHQTYATHHTFAPTGTHHTRDLPHHTYKLYSSHLCYILQADVGSRGVGHRGGR